jgi:hypothetical protein
MVLRVQEAVLMAGMVQTRLGKQLLLSQKLERVVGAMVALLVLVEH